MTLITVISSANGKALPGVNIYQGPRESPSFLAVTDGQGRAELAPGVYMFSHIGFKTASYDIPPSTSTTVILQSTSYQLDEVLIRPEQDSSTSPTKKHFGLWVLVGIAVLFYSTKK